MRLQDGGGKGGRGRGGGADLPVGHQLVAVLDLGVPELEHVVHGVLEALHDFVGGLQHDAHVLAGAGLAVAGHEGLQGSHLLLEADAACIIPFEGPSRMPRLHPIKTSWNLIIPANSEQKHGY